MTIEKQYVLDHSEYTAQCAVAACYRPAASTRMVEIEALDTCDRHSVGVDLCSAHDLPGMRRYLYTGDLMLRA